MCSLSLTFVGLPQDYNGNDKCDIMISFYVIDTMITSLLPSRQIQNRLNGKTFLCVCVKYQVDLIHTTVKYYGKILRIIKRKQQDGQTIYDKRYEQNVDGRQEIKVI